MQILSLFISLIISLIIILYIIGGFIIPLSDKLSKSFNIFKNVYIQIIYFIISISCLIFSPVIILMKYYPKDPEKIRNKKINQLVKSAEYYRDIENYKFAYEKYDSAELISNNKYNFHFEKSEMKYRNNEIEDALRILNLLVTYNESKNIYKEKHYEYRSLYHYDLGILKNAINDLEICIRHSKYVDVSSIFQVSILYLLENNLDSSNYYLIKYENLLHDLEESDFESASKQLNYLRSIINIRKLDKTTACAYYNIYELKIKARDYCNYSADSYNSKFKDCKHRFDKIFKDEFDKVVSECK
jgi:hypothetical protein